MTDPSEPCRPLTGAWVSVYDGATWTQAADLQVDHVVARKDAYASGGHTWNDDQIHRFVGWQTNLQAVTAKVNSSKGERGPDEWPYQTAAGLLATKGTAIPMAPNGACWYASVYVATKTEFALTVTSSQLAALDRLLATCTPGAAQPRP